MNDANACGTAPACSRTLRMFRMSSCTTAAYFTASSASNTITGIVMPYFISFLRISKTIAGFALPFDAFMTGPTSAFIAFSLPALNWSIAF